MLHNAISYFRFSSGQLFSTTICFASLRWHLSSKYWKFFLQSNPNFLCGYLVKTFRTDNPPKRNNVATQLATSAPASINCSPQRSQRALKQIIQFIVNVSLPAFCRRYGKRLVLLLAGVNQSYTTKMKMYLPKTVPFTFTFICNWKRLFVVSRRNELMSSHYGATYMKHLNGKVAESRVI